MNWLFDVLDIKPPSLNEPLVDCNRCQLKSPLKRAGDYTVESKCCEFSPFWSSFAIGAWLEAGNGLRSLKAIENGEMIVTSIGIMHSLEHRLKADSLCMLFKKETKNCSIWAHRPPTCFTFFCASQYKDGISQYSVFEDWMLSIESAAIKLYFQKEGIGLEVWDKWVEYMEPEPAPESFPSELLLSDYSKAEELYRKSYLWLKESWDCANLRFAVKQSWQDQFAENPIVGND